MLINNHKGLAEQLGNCDLHSVLQSCCRAGQSSNEMLARIVLNRLAEHKLPSSQEDAGTLCSRPIIPHLPALLVISVFNLKWASAEWISRLLPHY